ncbi:MULTISPECIES: type III pantothenate kinase [unclassified Saccharibacter]|uniref:type III pantothenate kinase n=1 Tax=unclassified Saccharibacter TaxID=2648722 RepID=UPI001329EA96|nr:type III pantothenate kinase [Saccharibacter sp. EH611]MXV58087.1 type III pantothenate kinase [Saccharibacter sp. EH70]MXV65361.1 type III pantothenate kinase [Saccharibacter sp. EH60]
MLLVIDAGNTNVVFAVHDGTAWCGRWRISTDDRRTSDEYASWLLGLMERVGLDPAAINRAIIGTVVPAVLYDLRRFCRSWLGVEPLVANNDLDWDMEVLVDQPDELGADRRLNGLAAHRLYAGSLVVVDFGTATTFDVIDQQGRYCGGAIAPGVNLSMDALHQAAARLPRVSVGRPAEAIGRSTSVAMRSGLFWGYVGLVEGIVRQIRAEMNEAPKVVATGGLAPLFSEGTAFFDEVAPDLTLDGLRFLAQQNEQRFTTTSSERLVRSMTHKPLST